MNNRLQSTGLAALSFSLSAGLLALALAPAMAHAAALTDSDQFTVTGERPVASRRVATADLDLASLSDLKRLDARISRAIGQVCREPGYGRATIESSHCESDARRSANQQVAVLRSATALAVTGSQREVTSAITILAAR